MKNLFKKFSSGDTLIEVLIAVSVFSIVAVGGVAVMNRGAATAQRSLEITLVRQEIDAQAEALRLLNETYISEYVVGKTSNFSTLAQRWRDISTDINTTDTVSDFGLGDKKTCNQINPPYSNFVINTRTLEIKKLTGVVSPATYAKINYNNTNPDIISSVGGLWIEAVKGGELSSASSRYIDFHIRACWDSIGQLYPITIGTIVRLYEPRG